MQIDSNFINLTLRYLDMAQIPASEAVTFVRVRQQWQAILDSPGNKQVVEEVEDVTEDKQPDFDPMNSL